MTRRRVKPGTAPVVDRCGLTGKARYRTLRAALDAITAVQARQERHGRPVPYLRAYQCQRCAGGWHMTSAVPV